MSAASNRETALELRAGIFVLLGFVFIAVMALKFGRIGQGLFQHYYPITVTFPSADGLIKDADVQLAGARVGYVADKPVISSSGNSVTIPLQILAGVKIPRETSFVVDSAGLLGDKFVKITPNSEFSQHPYDPSDPKQVLPQGATVEGETGGGLLGQLQGPKGEKMLNELTAEIEKLTTMTDRINTGILSPANEQNMTDTFSNLKETTDRFKAISKELDPVVHNASGVIDSAKTTLGTVNAAAMDVRTAIFAAEKALDSAGALLAKAQTGDGPIATLLNNKQLSADLTAFVANLREHGVLFYKNKGAVPAASPTPRPPAGPVGRQY
jgi:phospholipid/cholesterol/gamma-HCH transport system substrate-binding protein